MDLLIRAEDITESLSKKQVVAFENLILVYL